MRWPLRLSDRRIQTKAIVVATSECQAELYTPAEVERLLDFQMARGGGTFVLALEPSE